MGNLKEKKMGQPFGDASRKDRQDVVECLRQKNGDVLDVTHHSCQALDTARLEIVKIISVKRRRGLAKKTRPFQVSTQKNWENCAIKATTSWQRCSTN